MFSTRAQESDVKLKTPSILIYSFLLTRTLSLYLGALGLFHARARVLGHYFSTALPNGKQSDQEYLYSLPPPPPPQTLPFDRMVVQCRVTPIGIDQTNEIVSN